MHISKEAFKIMLNTGKVRVYTRDMESYKDYELVTRELLTCRLYHSNKRYKTSIYDVNTILKLLVRKKYKQVQIMDDATYLILR